VASRTSRGESRERGSRARRGIVLSAQYLALVTSNRSGSFCLFPRRRLPTAPAAALLHRGHRSGWRWTALPVCLPTAASARPPLLSLSTLPTDGVGALAAAGSSPTEIGAGRPTAAGVIATAPVAGVGIAAATPSIGLIPGRGGSSPGLTPAGVIMAAARASSTSAGVGAALGGGGGGRGGISPGVGAAPSGVTPAGVKPIDSGEAVTGVRPGSARAGPRRNSSPRGTGGTMSAGGDKEAARARAMCCGHGRYKT